MSLLAVHGLNQSYGGSHTLWDVDLSVPPGSRTCLMGRNGTGKTTLLKCVMGLVRSDSGTITFMKDGLRPLPAEARARLGIGYVPQGREIFARLTVQENLRMGLAYKNGSTPVPGEMFELFPVLKKMLNRRGGDLSGGQQQQLAIARALATKPKVLLLDEPTEGIQPSIIKDMARTLKRIRDERGLSIVVSEQVLSFALDIADRVLVIENGEIVRDDPRDAVDAAQVSKYLSV